MIIGESYMNSYRSEVISNELADVKATNYAACDSFIEAAYQAMIEDTTNWNTLNKRLIAHEISIEESGQEVVYEAVDIKALVSKAIALIKSWLSKILGVIQKFMTEVAAKLADMTKWVGVQKKALTAHSGGDSKVEYPENKRFESINYSDVKNNSANFIEVSDMTDHVTAKSFDGKNNSEMKSFSLSGYIPAGDEYNWARTKDVSVQSVKNSIVGTTKVSVPTPDMTIDKTLEKITKFGDGIKTVNDARNKAKSSADKSIKNLRALEKELGGSKKDAKDKNAVNDNMKAVHGAITAVSRVNSLNTMLVTARLQILMSELGMYRKIAGGYFAAIHSGEKAAKDKDAIAAKDKEARSIADSGKELNALRQQGEANKKPEPQNNSAIGAALGFTIV